MNDAIRELQTVTETELETNGTRQADGPASFCGTETRFPDETEFPASRRRTGSRPFSLDRLSKIKAQLATYATTETLFKTEIRRQYPELELGPSFTRDEGEKEVGGEIGFNLPLWNRNRKAIAEARGTRDLSRQETIQLWKTELFNARQLDASQQMALRHCRTELQRMESFAASVRTMEKLHGIGEASLLELAENRHQLYESRLAFLDNLDKLLAVQAQLRYLTHANL